MQRRASTRTESDASTRSGGSAGKSDDRGGTPWFRAWGNPGFPHDPLFHRCAPASSVWLRRDAVPFRSAFSELDDDFRRLARRLALPRLVDAVEGVALEVDRDAFA